MMHIHYSSAKFFIIHKGEAVTKKFNWYQQLSDGQILLQQIKYILFNDIGE